MTRLPLFLTTRALALAAFLVPTLVAPAAATLVHHHPQVLDTSEVPYAYSGSSATGDFNGDGQDDLALAVIHDGSQGWVSVFFGQDGGLVLKAVLIAGPGDSGFGQALAAGDFDGDDEDELAIGIPFAYVDGDPNNSMPYGAVAIWNRDSSTGDWTEIQRFWEGVGGITGPGGFAHQTGFALAAGNFDGNYFDDLAFSCPGHPVNGHTAAGIVHVLYGSFGAGLTAASEQVWSQDSSGISGVAEDYDGFGETLLAGDFNGDYRSDLVVGVPNEDIDAIENAGAIHVLYGDWIAGGLVSAGSQLIFRNATDVAGTSLAQARFGAALAAGRLDAGSAQDLVVGVPGDTIGLAPGAGTIHIFYGTGSGLSLATDTIVALSDLGLVGNKTNNNCGDSVAVGRFSATGFDTVAFGCPGYDNGLNGVIQDSGVLVLLPFNGAGKNVAEADQLNSVFVYGLSYYQTGDHLGRKIAFGQLNGDTIADLIVPFRGNIDVLLSNPELFSDKFETGNLLNWSAVVQ